MEEKKQILDKYHQYLEKIIEIFEAYSDEKIIEKFIQESEIEKSIDIFNVVRLVRTQIYNSRNISNAIQLTINRWSVEQELFFMNSIQTELESLESIFRGYSFVIHEAALPSFGEGGISLSN